MRLYSRDDLDAIPWPANDDSDYARRVLTPLVRDGARPYIANVRAEVRVLIDGDIVLPVAVVDSAHQLAPPPTSRRRRLITSTTPSARGGAGTRRQPAVTPALPAAAGVLAPAAVRRPDRSDRLRQQLAARHEPVSGDGAGHATAPPGPADGDVSAARRRLSLGERPAQRRAGRPADGPRLSPRVQPASVYSGYPRRRISQEEVVPEGSGPGPADALPPARRRAADAGRRPAPEEALRRSLSGHILPLQSAVHRGVLPGGAASALADAVRGWNTRGGSTACSGSWSGRG